MKGKWIAGLAIVAGVAFFAWRQESAPDAPAVEAQAAAAPSSARGSNGSVVGAAPGAPLMRPAAAMVAHPPPRPSLASELDNAKSLKALYDRLANSPEGQTADGQYALYRILRACANVTDRRFARPRGAPADDQRRQAVEALPDTDPNKAKRLAAMDQLAEDRCVGLTGIVTTEAELAKRLADAVAAGSPNARVFQVEQDMWAERRVAANESGRRGYVGPTLSDGQLEALRNALSTKEPEAMVTAGRILANSFRDLSVRIGNDGSLVEGRALNNAFTMLACEYGYPCGDNNLRLLNACAYEGHCATGNLQDYLFYYGSTPNENALQDQYRTLLRNAIETGNWSALNFVRGPTLAGNARFFGPPPR